MSAVQKSMASLAERYPLTFDLLLLLFLGGAMLFPFLGQNANWASREIRHAQIMREMAETGDFTIPRLMGEVYYDKPPVMHMLGAKLMQVSDEPNLFHARFPSALAAVVSLLAVYGLGRMLGGRRIGLLSALILLAMPGFWLMARVARPDLTLVAWILIACLCLGLGMQCTRREVESGWLVAGGIAAAFAVITKGPYGLLVPMLFLAFAPRDNPSMERPGWRFLWFMFGLMLTIAAWSLPTYLRDGGAYLRGVIFQEDLPTGGGRGHFEPFYWYLGPGFLDTLPMILLLPFAIRRWRREDRFPAAFWIALVIFIVLSCVPGKRRHYLLPMLPFLALALASGFVALGHYHVWLRRAALTTLLGGVLAGPLYFGPILGWLRPQGDPEGAFVAEVLKILPPDATVVCLDSMAEYMAWVGGNHRRIVAVQTAEEAEAALRTRIGDCYLVASDVDFLKLKEDDDLEALQPVVERKIARKGPWLLAFLDK